MFSKLIAALGLTGQDQQMTAIDYEFMRYVTEFGKQYATKSEFDMRAKIFAKSFNAIEKHNASGQTHQLGLNHLSDFTKTEYKALLGYRPELRPARVGAEELATENLDADVNWVTKGAVTGVKN